MTKASYLRQLSLPVEYAKMEKKQRKDIAKAHSRGKSHQPGRSQPSSPAKPTNRTLYTCLEFDGESGSPSDTFSARG